MSTIGHSREARAARRFVEATRSVDQAFREVRGDHEEGVDSVAYAAAQSRLDAALDELARAQELFDTAVSVRGTRHY
ncbi:MAG: hypothetical protein GAK40_01200 [Burkholderia plantarii]|nr:MAG: hypothetical protein GAK40_01200 [Burkholderia plantarii]